MTLGGIAGDDGGDDAPDRVAQGHQVLGQLDPSPVHIHVFQLRVDGSDYMQSPVHWFIGGRVEEICLREVELVRQDVAHVHCRVEQHF